MKTDVNIATDIGLYIRMTVNDSYFKCPGKESSSLPVLTELTKMINKIPCIWENHNLINTQQTNFTL